MFPPPQSSKGQREEAEMGLKCAFQGGVQSSLSLLGRVLLAEDFNVTRLTATDDLLSRRCLIKTGIPSMLGDKEAPSILRYSRRDSGT